ncbi:MAG: response regulator [Myxococcota bacterium]
MMIYVLDDELFLCRALARQITALDCEARAAQDLGQLLAFGGKPDLLLVDFNLGGMDAIGCAPAIEKAWPGTPRVLITASYLTPEQSQKIRELGFSRVLKKPWTIDELRGLLGHYGHPGRAERPT